MNDAQINQTTAESLSAAQNPKVREKRPIDILRERHGGMSPEMKEYYKEQTRIKQLLKEALARGAKTVPELARECGLEPSVTMWNLMAMRRYGKVVEEELRGEYYAYRLKEVK
ncbi:MAG: hypothetical protein JXQ27_01495 [Acidobacteria bacterium]|nr:hypothetical protein [Acidobacteriota bacterium]